MALYDSNFRWQDINNLGKQLMGNQQLRALQLQQGKINPWDTPEFQQAQQGLRRNYDIGLSDLADAYRQSGVTGGAAALGMERAGQGYENSLSSLANAMRGYPDRQVAEAINTGKWTREQLYRAWLAKKAQEAQGGGMPGLEALFSGLGSLAGGMGGGMGGKPQGGTPSPNYFGGSTLSGGDYGWGGMMQNF